MKKILQERSIAEKIDREGMLITSHQQYSHTNASTGEFVFDDYFNSTEFRIYVRYLRGVKQMTYKPIWEEVKKKIINWEDLKLQKVGYKVMPDMIKSICSHVKKGEDTLIEIPSIKIPKAMKDYIVGLYRAKCPEAKDRPIKSYTIDVLKIMFTLYVWTQIQGVYSKYPNYISSKGMNKYLLQVAHVEGLKHLRDIIGFLYVSKHIDVPFVKEAWIWKGPEFEDCEEYIELRDLEHIGLYVESWLMAAGTEGKWRECPKCGKMFRTKSSNTHTVCEDCRRERARLKKRRQRAKKIA